jgi:hypothetical protein
MQLSLSVNPLGRPNSKTKTLLFFLAALIAGLGPREGFGSEPIGAWPWVSEVLADPAFATDSEGEFIELCLDSSATVSVDSFTLSVDGKAKKWSSRFLEPGKAFTICRDSAAGESWGIPCRAEWPQLSLANGRLIWIQVRVDSIDAPFFDAILPVSEPGVAQENHATRGDAADFRPSSNPFRGGFASPGNCLPHASQAGSEIMDNPSLQSEIASPVHSIAPSSLRTPWLTGKTVSLAHPDRTHLGIPSSFTNGSWKLATPQGLVLLSGKTPAKATWVPVDALWQTSPVLRLGPLVLVVERGSKRWLRPLVVVP